MKEYAEKEEAKVADAEAEKAFQKFRGEMAEKAGVRDRLVSSRRHEAECKVFLWGCWSVLMIDA